MKEVFKRHNFKVNEDKTEEALVERYKEKKTKHGEMLRSWIYDGLLRRYEKGKDNCHM